MSKIDTLLSKAGVMLSGTVNDSVARDRNANNEASLALAMIAKASNEPSKTAKQESKTQGKQANQVMKSQVQDRGGLIDPDDENELIAKDANAYKDYIRKVSELYNQLNQSTAEGGGPSEDGGFSNVYEIKVERKLGDIAQAYGELEMAFKKQIASSRSSFFSEQVKLDAKESVTAMEALLGKVSTGQSRARAMRAAFLPRIYAATIKQFPSIDPSMLASWEELKDLQNRYGAERFFDPFTSTSDSSYISNPYDQRGAADVNASYKLHFLHITPYFKTVLKDLGVSEAILDLLGNFTQKRLDTPVDESSDFSAEYFEDEYNTKEDAVASKYLKRWGGHAACSQFQLELIDFIKSWRAKSTAIIASGNNSADDNIYTGVNKNSFSPDLAVKAYMMLALNAVYKVMLEDGTATMERTAQSQIDNLSLGIGARLYDTAMDLLDTNTGYLNKPVEAAKDFLSSQAFRYNQKIYKFLKENWAPIVKKFSVTGAPTKYVGNVKLPDEQITCTIYPRLYLPINPFDRGSASIFATERFYESNGSRKSSSQVEALILADESARSAMFKGVRLPMAYLDPRNRESFRSIEVKFDNMLSHAMFVCARNSRFNPASYRAEHVRDANGEIIFNPSTLANDYVGPHVIGRDSKNAFGWVPGVSSSDKWLTFYGDMYCSGVDRLVKTGHLNGIQFACVSPQDASAFINDSSGSSARTTGKMVNSPFYWPLFHTNPWSHRFMSTARFFNTSGSVIKHLSEVNQSMTRFIEGVLDGDKSLFSTKTVQWSPAAKVAIGEHSGSLAIHDAFRHSVITDGNSKIIFDNQSADVPTLLVDMAQVDDSTPVADKHPSYLLTRIDDIGHIDRKAAEAAFKGAEGDFDFFGGKEHTVSEDKVANAAAVSHLRKTTIATLLNASNSFLNSCRYRLSAKKPIVEPPKYHTLTGRNTTFYALNRIPGFTKSVCAASPEAAVVDAAGAHLEAVPLFHTIIGKESRRVNDITSWANACKAWNRVNADLVNYVAGTTEFDTIADFIFSFIPDTHMTTSEQSSVNKDKKLSSVRYSYSLPVIIATEGIGSDGANLDRCVVDPSIAQVTGTAHVFKSMPSVNINVTRSMMRVLRQLALDSTAATSPIMLEKPPHGRTLKLNPAVVYLDARKMIYDSHLPENVSEHAYTSL